MPAVGKETAESADVFVDDADFDDASHGWRYTIDRLLPSSVSLLVHTVILLLLAIVTYEETSQEISRLVALPSYEVEDPPVEVELDPEIDVVVENVALFNAAVIAKNDYADLVTLKVHGHAIDVAGE